MALFTKEAKEWKSLLAKSKRHGVSVRRVGPANVSFGGDVYAQLGTGRATEIMDARIKIKKRSPESGRYWGRFKVGGKWSSLWHLIAGATSRDDAFGKFVKNTRYMPHEIQITTREPKRYAGRNPRG